MSSSDASDMSRVNLTDDADAIAQKVRRAKTDPEPLPSEVEGLTNRPEADNLVGIYGGLAGLNQDDVLREFGGGQFSTFKTALADLMVSKVGPIGDEMRRLIADPVEIDRILIGGADRARSLAAPIIADTKRITGFVGA